jgi:quinol monooxygenase YgiN
VVAYAKAKPGKEEEVRKEFLYLVAETRKEPGCVVDNLHESLDKKDYYFFYQNWVNREEWEKHMKTPHIQRWFNELAPVLCEQSSADITMWEMVVPPKA